MAKGDPRHGAHRRGKDVDQRNAKIAAELKRAAQQREEAESKARAKAAYAGWQAAKKLLRGKR